MRHLILVACCVSGLGMAMAAPATGGDDPDLAEGAVFRCESSGGRTRECPADTSRGVRLVRQVSRVPCTEGQTWGAGRAGVWVTQGCGGDFARGHGSSGGSGSGYGAQVLRCESSDGRRKLCPADARDHVQLVRQLSRSPCVRNQTWGTSQRGVWVSQGCRAEFRLGGGSRRGDGDVHDGSGAQVVRCESPRGAQNQCRIDARGRARLLRQLSSSPCVEGRTWGQDRGGVWVRRGCRADFEIGGTGFEHDDDSEGMGQVMTCESTEGRQGRCDIDVNRGARMIRQLSRS
ncbi:MAG: DUF3011 domain-containing protein, partial [Luteimonas sp.]